VKGEGGISCDAMTTNAERLTHSSRQKYLEFIVNPMHFNNANYHASFYMSCLFPSWRAFLLTSLCSIGNHSLTPESEGAELQCLPLYSILLALGNPTVNYFRQPISRLVTDFKGLTLFLHMQPHSQLL
jgi:hypothetical protein